MTHTTTHMSEATRSTMLATAAARKASSGKASKASKATTVHGSAWDYVAARTFGGGFRATVRDITTRQASQSWVRIDSLSATVEQSLDDVLSATRLSFVEQWQSDICGTATREARLMVAADSGTVSAIRVGSLDVGSLMIPARGDDDDMRAVSVERLLYRAAYRAARRIFPTVARCSACKPLPTPCRKCVNACAGTGATLDATAWETVAAGYADTSSHWDDMSDSVHAARLPRDVRTALRLACETVAEMGQDVVASNGRPNVAVWEAMSLAAGNGIGAAAVRTMRETVTARMQG